MPSETWIEASARDRRIRCRLGAAVFANPWSSVEVDEVPVWLRFAGTKAQTEALCAHLRSGGRASYATGHLRAPGRGLCWDRQRDEATGAVVVTAYQPELIRLSPLAEVGDVVGGVAIIPRSWLERHAADGLHEERTLRAMFLVAHLDRRTRWPIPRNPQFLRRLAMSLYERGAVALLTDEPSEAGRVVGDLGEMGLDSILGFCLKDEELGEVIRDLAKEHPAEVLDEEAASGRTIDDHHNISQGSSETHDQQH